MVKLDLGRTYTVEEYFALKAKSESRHEFYYGKLYELSGNALLHNELCQSIYFALREQKLNELYSIAIVSLKVKIPDEDIYLYPDVVLGQKVENPAETFVIPNPIFIAEVLSDSTRCYDRTAKFIQYRKIDSLQYYLLVEPEKQVVNIYEKTTDGDWIAKTYTHDDEAVKLPILNATIMLGDIYGK